MTFVLFAACLGSENSGREKMNGNMGGNEGLPYELAPALPGSCEEGESVPAETRVGAIRRFFGCWVGVVSGSLLPSFSDSLVVRTSRLPRTLTVVPAPPCETVDNGVCGGVVSGSAEGCAECVAVTSGTEPRVGVGLFTTLCWFDDWVMIEEAELERAGLAGGAWDELGAEPLLFVGAWLDLTGDGGTCVGVGRGVAIDELAEPVVLIGPVGPV